MNNTFILNILTVREPDGTYSAACPQMALHIQSRPTQAEAEQYILDRLANTANDNRNACIQMLTDLSMVFDVTSIPCELKMESATKTFSETPNDIARKIELLEVAGTTGIDATVETLSLECEKKYVLSLHNKDILSESKFLSEKLQYLSGILNEQKENTQQ